MKKVVFVLFVIGLVSCSSKKQWSKEYVEKNCNADLSRKNEKEKLFNDEQVKTLCDCVAGKMVTQFKSQAEADKDLAGSRQIGTDCTLEVLQQE